MEQDLARLEASRDPQEFVAHSQRLIAQLQRAQSSRGFETAFYDDFASSLLSHLLVRWGSALSASELAEQDFYFGPNFSPKAELLVLSASLESVADKVVLDFIFRQLTCMLAAESRVRDLLLEMAHDTTDELLVNRVGSLPDRVLNALSKQQQPQHGEARPTLPPCFQPEMLFGGVLRTAMSLLLDTTTNRSNSPQGMQDVVSNLSSKFCRLGYCNVVVNAFLPLLQNRTPEGREYELVKSALMNTSTSALEPLFVALIARFASKKKTPSPLWPLVKDCLLTPQNAHERFVRSLLTYKFFLTKSFSRPVLECLVATLAQNPGLVEEVLTLISKVWAEQGFVRQSSVLQHSYVTRAIVLCIHTLIQLKNQGDFSTSPFMSSLMEGVQIRLSSSILDIRKHGMRVATAFSKMLDPKEPLSFDELKDDEWQDEGLPLEADTPSDNDNDNDLPNEIQERVSPQEEEEDDPDQPFTKKSMDWSSSVILDEEKEVKEEDQDEEDGLVAYDLADDEEDLRKVPLPVYPQQCLEYFRKTEDRDRVEAGLEALERIVKAIKIDDFPADLALHLMKALHQLGTSGWLDETKWEGLRIKDMVAIVCKCPLLMGPHLAGQFYASNRSLKDRMDCLDVLVMSAQELAAAPLSEHAPRPSGELKFVQPQIKAIEDDRVESTDKQQAIVRARVEKNTKRRKHVDPQLVEPHGFGAEVAEAFFYPLIRTAEQSAVRVISSEPFLLGRLLHALAAFVDCAGASGGSMARELRALLWFSRQHEEAVVRRASLYGLSRLLALKLGVQEAVEDITNWLHEARNDPDEECRQLALLCWVSLATMVESLPKIDDDIGWSFSIPSRSTLTMHL